MADPRKILQYINDFSHKTIYVDDVYNYFCPCTKDWFARHAIWEILKDLAHYNYHYIYLENGIVSITEEGRLRLKRM